MRSTCWRKAAGDTSSPDAYDLLGDAYTQQKNYAKAEAAYRKAVDEDPDDPGHRHGLAQALLSQDKYAEALEQYTKLSQLEPGTAENYLRMAQLDRRLGKIDEAEASLLRAKQLSPGSIEVLYNEALLYEDENRYDDAVKVLTDAIAGVKNQAGNEDNSNALSILYEQLGHAYREARKYPEAVQTFQEMEKLGPDAQKRAELLLIETYRDSHQIDSAITEAKKALDASPKDPGLTVSLAMLYGEKSDAAQGTKILQGLLQGNDSDQEIYIDIAQVQERGKLYADAEQSAQKAEQMARDQDGRETAWYMLGAIYERQKKFDLAEQQFRRVLDASPNNAAVLNYYGYMLANRGIRLDEATSLIQQAVQQDPNNGAYLDSLGWAYLQAEQADRSGAVSSEGGGSRGTRSDDPQPSGRCVHQAGTERARRRAAGTFACGMAEGDPRGLRSGQGERDRRAAENPQEAPRAEIFPGFGETAVSFRHEKNVTIARICESESVPARSGAPPGRISRAADDFSGDFAARHAGTVAGAVCGHHAGNGRRRFAGGAREPGLPRD
jgi:tetratricopeptide (TPR) repeat protein